MLQIDGPKRQVFIKLNQYNAVQRILKETKGSQEYKHSNGEISHVRIEMAGLGTKRIRIANLPPEVPEGIIRSALIQYGEIQGIQEETWARTYRYPVLNGIKIITMILKKHIPSNVVIASNRVLISYDGQPITCYGCNATDHVYQMCPKRTESKKGNKNEQTSTWAQVARVGSYSSDKGGNLENANHPPNMGTPEEENLEGKETVMDTDIGQQYQTEQITPRVQSYETTPGTANDNDDTFAPEATGTGKPYKQSKEDKNQTEDPNTGRTQQELGNLQPKKSDGERENDTTGHLHMTEEVPRNYEDPNDQHERSESSENRNSHMRTKTKKLKLESNGEPSHERKRSRTRHTTTNKEK
jgi:hypothetical protein